MASPSARMPRSLSRRDAIVLGLGSMIGAGVFAAFGPAAAAAGSGTGLLLALLLAAVVAWCNATSSAQLAAQYPDSGGTYVYGRERLGDTWGFAAGWSFVVGKTASCAAMATTAAGYALGSGAGAGIGTRLVAVGVLAALSAVLLTGIAKTARVATVLLTITLAVLALAVAGVVVTGGDDVMAGPVPAGPGATCYGVLQAAGLLFFAFAGYARIATLGEEVRDPQVTIPAAITSALAIVVLLYAAVAGALLSAIGPVGLASSALPLADALATGGQGWASVVVRAGAVVASCGALLGLLAGVSRTMLAMARRHDLPARLSALSARDVPAAAQVAVALAAAALALVADLRHAIGFSSAGVLLYYAIANACAWTQDPAHRRWPRPVQALGLVGCLALVATLPPLSVGLGLGVVLVGIAGRALLTRTGRRRAA